ncbi:hypothetical protein Hamer_G022111 [Homarus americanus]|uniref:CUB domain-containing protein n=1 Tax=Homarus americanus TaxID=6706 RepID=A0A8J5MLD0_HOMAM|nr:hypothetical protein Hamer_G022111 [Homarus americanus]
MKTHGTRLTLMVVLLVGVVTTAPSDSDQEGVSVLQQEQQLHEGEEAALGSNREEKVFLVLLKIQPDMCVTSDTTHTMGTCLPSKDCTRNGGTSSGTCAKGYGACCIAQHTCSQSSNYNNTYFVNPSYSGTDTGTDGACTLTINRVNSNICQIRLDFLNFNLSQPDINGNCNDDFLTVTPTTSTVPRICGDNDDQHMYMDVDPAGGPIRLTVDLSSASTIPRSWDIKIRQIPCDSEYQAFNFSSLFFMVLTCFSSGRGSAPSGCLQYYTATSGTVNSFNFNNAAPTPPEGTRQLANLDYGVCIEMAPGYCGIIWERNTTAGNYSFSVSGNADALDPAIAGMPDAGQVGGNCTTDYVMIPGGMTDTGINADRYCGLGFPNSVTSTMKPFTLYVHQNEAEVPNDFGNRGFSLNYRQITNC